MFDFISPARIKILLVPINNSTISQFKLYYNQIISNVSEIRLLDITIDQQLQYFNPNSSPNGRIIPEFITTQLDNESIFLHDFEPFRKIFIVLGIGPYKEGEGGGGGEDNISELKSVYSSSIVHNIILFDSPEISNTREIFHHNFNQPITALETIFCDISKNFLIALDNYALSYSNITLRSPVSITDSHVLTKTISHAQKRLSSGSTSFKASFEGDLKTKNHLKYLGRQKKLMGYFYLLCGKYSDAFSTFIESLTSLKKSDDYLWLASALEGLSVSILLLLFINQSFQIPNQLNSILHISKKTEVSKISESSANSSPRNSMNGSFSFSSLDFNTMSYTELIKIINFKVVQYYDSSTNDFENMVPDIVYIECILRKIKLMISLHYGNSIENIVMNKLEYENMDSNFSKKEILEEIDRIFTLQLVDLPIVDQCRIYSSLAGMYDELKLYRKKAFILRILLIGLLPKLHLVKHSIKEILENLYKLYGINYQPETSIKDASSQNWISLQIQLLKLSLKIAESLNDRELLLNLCILLLTRFTHCLPMNDQIKLREKIGNKSCKYWDPFLLRDVQLVNKQKEELIPFKEYENQPSQEEPFFDPYKKKIETARNKILIKDDVYQLKVTLQNPFSFDIEINDIVLNGVETIKNLISVPLNGKLRKKAPVSTNQTSSLIVPPMSTEQFLVSFKPLKTGILTISGLNIIVGHCEEQFFKIVEKETFEDEIKLENEKSEESTLDKVIENLSLTSSRVSYKELQLSVIPPQPLLILSEISVSNLWLMLLEGEKFQFSVKLTNTSEVEINYLSYSFWDSTIEYINKKLQTQLNSNEIYDLEYDLVKFKPFKIINKDVMGEKIYPNQSININYEITSRKMMKELRIILDYANKSTDDIFVKQLNIPLNVSVMSSIEIVGCDILPNFKIPNIETTENQSLLILDLRNCWTEKLTCRLKYKSHEFSNSIESNKTKRFIIPIDKLNNEIDLTKAIPSLVNKQFIKNYNLSEDEEKQMKELFWLRYHLLSNLSGKWSSKSRKGIIDLRNLRITNKMSNNLKIDNILITNSIENMPKQRKYQLKLDTFYNLKTTIINNSNESISGIIRHLPMPLIGNTRQLSIDKKLLINGVLQNKVATIKPKQKLEIVLSFVIIEKGEFEWGTIIDLVDRKLVCKDSLYIQV
ncbi:unnamed protein product [Candida verbasci]|uniref:Uncharacterized protein n=1 Tax=Candida verbasci TaxID=1227364 RepID=A0A9W4TV45_9ASCO|nr:unnamed protein product [Candida verbasci]